MPHFPEQNVSSAMYAILWYYPSIDVTEISFMDRDLTMKIYLHKTIYKNMFSTTMQS